jgi:hypothetical protein
MATTRSTEMMDMTGCTEVRATTNSAAAGMAMSCTVRRGAMNSMATKATIV